MKEKLKVGLDFGTSNSAIAAVENDRVRIFETKEGQPTQPSSIFIRIDGYISVGNQAIRDFQNPEQHVDEFHFIPSIKPGLPIEYYDGNVLRSKKTIVNGRFLTRYFPIQELGGSLIADLKNRAEEASGKKAEGVVLGRPVYFSEDKKEDKLAQDRLETAAREAGFQEVHFVLEPVAAALYYEKYHSTQDPHKVFVFDFGGGTLDVSVLNFDRDQLEQGEFRASELSDTVLGTNGVDLGGTDLDKDVFEDKFLRYFGSDVTYDKKGLPMPAHVHHDITEWHLLEHEGKRSTYSFLRQIANDPYCSDRDAAQRLVTLVEDQQVYSVLRSVEAAKIRLSSTEKTHIEHDYENIQIDEPISTKEFEAIIRPRLKSIQSCMDDCLRSAQVSPEDIDVVLKVGGSSNNLFVDEMLRRTFPGQIRGTDVFTSVVSGLAVAADDLLD
jgi:hypothetical chaperone protein